MAELLNGILDAAGMPAIQRSISASVAYTVGALFEGLYKLGGCRESQG